MKKIICSVLTLFTAVFSFYSCNRIDNVPSNLTEEGYMYTFSISEDLLATRATLDNDGVLWEAGDQVGMFIENPNGETIYSGYAKIDVTTSPKSVILYSKKAIPANSFAYAYYPFSDDNQYKTNNKIVIPKVQEGGANSAMPMVSIPFKVETEVPLDPETNKAETNGVLKFLNLGSIIDFKIYSSNSDYTSETVQYVIFQANGAVISGDAYIDLTKVTASNSESLVPVFKGGENEYDNVKVLQEAPVASSKDEATSIYMTLAPGTYSGTITIGTDVATYTFEFANKELGRNVIKHYNMNLSNATREAEVHETVESIPYTEAFTTGIGEFTINEVIPASEVGDIWTQSSTYGMVAKATTGSGKETVNYASEAWLISPWIDLTEVDAAVASFDHVHRYAGTASNELTFWVKSDDANAEWTKLVIPTYAPGNNWTFVNSGEISLASFSGKKIKVAFKYTSSTSNAATWEVKNFKVEEVVLNTEFTIASESITVQVGKTKNNPVSVNSGATISYSSGDESIATVDEEGNVTGVAVGETTITVSVPAYNGYPAKQSSYAIEVIPAQTEKDFTWDLSIASYASADANAVVWSNDNVTMQNAKGTGTDPNNYIPSTRTSTRFYSGNILTITPKGTCEITKIEFTATSENYASTLKGSTWTNATADIEGTTVTVTPIDGTTEINATIGGTCGLTAVKVYYTGGSTVVVTEYTITINETSNGTVVASANKATQGTEISLTITPATGYELNVLSIKDAENNDVAVNNFKFLMPASNVTVSATFKEKEVGSYVLKPTAGSNNSYAGNCDITIDDITWNVQGNAQQIPWRLGGKSLNGENRTIYSKTALDMNVKAIKITHGAASSITVNSMTVIVASDGSFNNVVSTLTPTFEANATITVTCPTNANWSNCYYKFIYNVTVSGTTNKFIEFTQAEFTGE